MMNTFMKNREIIVVAGPTAVGKTRFAIDVALAFHGEIVSCDSMQLYRYMDIGSAKPTPQEQAQVKHYLVDQIDPAQPFSVAEYQKMAKEAIENIFSEGKTPVIAGGTGLYLNSLLYDMDFSSAPQDTTLRQTLEKEAELFGPEYLYRKLEEADSAAAARIHPNNVKKVIRALEGAASGNPISDFRNCTEKCKDYHPILIGLTRNREELYDRINQRVDLLVEEGLFEEVEDLLDRGLTEDDISMKGIGYKEIIAFFDGRCSREEAIDLIKKNTRHLAKRQLTWFRRYEDMIWFNLSEYGSDEEAAEDIIRWLKNR
ncbi:MAG: tRNA (adenosine(37)-N6)-dimethylallyltransferase MiaA [Firmicutes bacterium]|nr:tRNA (adenosine(37)-N6)-dimethylallyltransferase MiaA [Bacillota bacterium]